MAKKKVLIISHDRIGSNMAGPGIRYHYMAEVLSADFDVTVGFFDPGYLPEKSFSASYSVAHIHDVEFHKIFEGKDAIISLYLNDDMIDYCDKHGIYLVFDIYAPVPVENLALALYGNNKITGESDFVYTRSNLMYERFFQSGDLFLLSNRRQLDYWIGYVFGADLIRLSSYSKREVFDRFVIAPMGIDAKSTLSHTKNVIRGVLPGVGDSDKVVLWTGGIWNWFDAQSLIRAMSNLAKKRPDIKLVFFGTKHPNPDVPEMKEALEAHNLAEELGVLGKNVFINVGWVSYADRINYLLEADVAANTTKQTIESELSHRTRVLDHILTSLPTIATAGDYLSDEVIGPKQLGIIVPPGDIDAIEKAILEIVDDRTNATIRSNVAAIRQDYDWQTVLAPLRDALLEMEKLPRVKITHIRKKRPSRAYKRIKQMVPSPVKKIILRTIRYGR